MFHHEPMVSAINKIFGLYVSYILKLDNSNFLNSLQILCEIISSWQNAKNMYCNGNKNCMLILQSLIISSKN